MPIFREMSPEMALKLTEGYENELDPAKRKLDAFYRQFQCPKCGGNMNKHFLGVQHAFGDPDSPVPRSGLKCLQCDLVLDPHSGVVVGLGTASEEIKQHILATKY